MSNEKSIDRRTFLKTASLASAGIFWTGSAIGASLHFKRKIKNPPNLILIMTDQQRFDTLGCTGNPVIKTPNLDSIAREGVIFANAYSSVPSCTPARSGLLTGLSPWHHGMLGYGRVGEKYKFEMPEMLRNAGYFTFGIGKMHWFPQKALHGFHATLVDESGRVEQPGFVSDYHDWFNLQAPGANPDATGIGWNEHRAAPYVLDERLHPTAWTGQTAVRLIQNYKLPQPLFLKVSFARPHSPYDPPPRFWNMYRDEEMPPPFVGEWAKKFAGFPMTKNAAYGNFGIEHARRARRGYYANITFIDQQIGKIINALKEKGMYDNALIIFTADHGDMLGDHYHWRKTYPYEGSAHVPLLMKLPSQTETVVKRGSTLFYPVELRDILPTFLHACGQPIPEEMDGDSLLKLVGKKNPSWRSFIDLEHATCYSEDNYWCALTDGRFKYVFSFYDGHEELFDIQLDKSERVNLADSSDFRDVLKLWRGRMAEHLSERGEGFVKDGKLQIRKETMLYGPNYPGAAKGCF
ncbi:MAG: arylsulfatase [Calditrichaeota bacterium]|nr:arylsulfatase [Calditrichota bacterium]